MTCLDCFAAGFAVGSWSLGLAVWFGPFPMRKAVTRSLRRVGLWPRRALKEPR